MSSGTDPRQQQLADLWERLVDRGLSEEEATRHVQLAERASSPEASAEDRAEAEKIFGGVGGAIGAGALLAGQGATLGFSDELAGLLAGAGAALPGGKSPKEAYGETVTGAREAIRQAREERPMLSTAADIARR